MNEMDRWMRDEMKMELAMGDGGACQRRKVPCPGGDFAPNPIGR